MKRLIFLCFIFSWACSIYGDDHQSVSLSWRPAIDFSHFEYNILGAGLEYTQQMDAFKWGAGLEYRHEYSNHTMFLSLQGAWVFQRQSQWMASLGIKLRGGAALIEYWQDSLLFYISPFMSFEYFFDDAFSFFAALQVTVDPFDMLSSGGLTKKKWAVMLEFPVGVSFYF